MVLKPKPISPETGGFKNCDEMSSTIAGDHHSKISFGGVISAKSVTQLTQSLPRDREAAHTDGVCSDGAGHFPRTILDCDLTPRRREGRRLARIKQRNALRTSSTVI